MSSSSAVHHPHPSHLVGGVGGGGGGPPAGGGGGGAGGGGGGQQVPAGAISPTSEATTTNTSTPTNQQNELDERIVAQKSLQQQEESVRQICITNAATFVEVERRGVQLRTSLQRLLRTLEGRCEPYVDAAHGELHQSDRLLDDDNDEGKAQEYGGEEDDEEEEQEAASKLLAKLAERHRLRRRTMLQHSSLLELLELPSLMDACVRSDLYDEALNVATFGNTLERRHHLLVGVDEGGAGGTSGGSGAVVASVIKEVRAREGDLRRHLLTQLRGDVSMPQCLEIVTALRRLNGIELERKQLALQQQQQQQQGQGGSTTTTTNNDIKKSSNVGVVDLERIHQGMEIRLQVDFFEARDKWLERGDTIFGSSAAAAAVVSSASGGGKKQNSTDGTITSTTAPSAATILQSEQLLDCIERHRTRCFEIATQFLAIFRTASPVAVPGGGGGGGGIGSSSSSSSTSISLLSMWCTRRIQSFLASLQIQLDTPGTIDHMSAASLRDALDSTVFFASSMGRIGADFQCLLPPIFFPRLVRIVTRHWDGGLDGLEETLKLCREAGVAGPLSNSSAPGATSGVGGGGGGGSSAAPTTDDGEAPSPPRMLLTYPPLARYVNSYLGGLNELRRCLLSGTFASLRERRLDLVERTREVLRVNERKVNTPGFLRGEAVKLRKVASELKDVFDCVVEPYLLEALDSALGYSEGESSATPPPPPAEPEPPAEEKTEEVKEDGGETENVEEEKESGKEEDENGEGGETLETVETIQTPQDADNAKVEAGVEGEDQGFVEEEEKGNS